MLKMELVEGRYAPVVICDWCGRLIDHADRGNYEYEVAEDGRPIGDRLFFTHTECCQAFEEARGGPGHWRMDDLRCLPLQLGVVLGIDWDEAAAQCGLGPYTPAPAARTRQRGEENEPAPELGEID
jgi:hypothetical protein